MRVGFRRIERGATAAAVVIGLMVAGTLPVSASGSPKASLSINASPERLTVAFVAQSSGFSSKVVSYAWTFGDGASTTTSSSTVTHTYSRPSTYLPAVKETDVAGASATASGTLAVYVCPSGTTSCTDSLTTPGSVQLLQASGPIAASSAAELNLFVGSFKVPKCEAAIAPAAALTDSGFTGSLSVTLQYTTSQPHHVGTTCFSSTVAFVDSAGKTVHNGALPMCPVTATPPCVQTIQTAGSSVTKVLSIPPGDPKVGAP
jgi:PKD repeat protein